MGSSGPKSLSDGWCYSTICRGSQFSAAYSKCESDSRMVTATRMDAKASGIERATKVLDLRLTLSLEEK